MAQQCEQIKPDGSRCRANARRDSTFCFFHDPATAAQRDAARQAGGRQRSRRAAVLPPTAPDLELKAVSDVVKVLGESINQTRRGELDPKVANAVGYLASVLLRALQGETQEMRLQALERVVLGRGNG
jgi:hypothetical protein